MTITRSARTLDFTSALYLGLAHSSWALRPWIEEQLSSERTARRGVLRPDYVRRILDEHFANQANHVAVIWCLLSFETWCNQHGAYGGVTDMLRD